MNEQSVHHIDSENPDIDGWYVNTNGAWLPDDLTWNDCGNGPEIQHGEMFGPFESESVAEQWLADYNAPEEAPAP